jgi:hypothetical protein
LSVFVAVTTFFVAFSSVQAATNYKGKMLVVKGDAAHLWYVSPVDGRRYDLGSGGQQAVAEVSEVALGISNADLAKIPAANSSAKGNAALRKRLAGRFLLAVQDGGSLWYVNPLDQKRHYLLTTDASYAHLRALALTVSANALKSIKIAFAYPDAPTPAANQPSPTAAPAPVTPATGCLYNNPACDAAHLCVNNTCVLKTGCDYANPACPAGQSCVSNQCQAPAPVATPVAPPTASSCQSPSCLDPRQPTLYDATASVKSVSMLHVGDSWTVASGRFLRVESVTPTQSVISLWLSDAQGCRYSDRLIVTGTDQKAGVSFGDVYLTALQLNGGIYADAFSGASAYTTCVQVMNELVEADKKQNITLDTSISQLDCDSLPGAGRYTVTSTDGLFRRLYKNSSWTPAESVLVDANDLWYHQMMTLFPAFSELRPADDAWHITEFTDELPYAGLLMPNGMLSKMDDQMVNQVITPFSTDVTAYNNARANIAAGSTYGVWMDAPIEEAHELGHDLTASTQLLTFSPAGYSTILGEGLADYVEGYATWPKAVADQYADALHCQDATSGTDNKPYSSNLSDYYAGQCFYYLYAKYCGGQSALNSAFADLINQTYRPSDTLPSVFSMLDAHCGDHTKFRAILTNYGVTDDLINKTGPLVPGLAPGNDCGAK